MIFSHFAILISDVIFGNKDKIEIEGKEYIVNETSQAKLRYVSFKIGKNWFKIMQQNPNKTSNWAKLAREGHKIAWVLDNYFKYYGRIMDGKYHELKPLEFENEIIK